MKNYSTPELVKLSSANLEGVFACNDCFDPRKGHSNGNGVGHYDHGNGNGYGHSKGDNGSTVTIPGFGAAFDETSDL